MINKSVRDRVEKGDINSSHIDNETLSDFEIGNFD